MMKFQVCLLLVVGVTLVLSATTSRPQVTDDALDSALSDKRYLMRQLKCALGEGPCDPVGRRLKSLAPLVLRGACPQCTPPGDKADPKDAQPYSKKLSERVGQGCQTVRRTLRYLELELS